MLRGCLLSLASLIALAVAYFYWLDQTFEPPASIVAGGIVGFLVLCCLGALNNARIAWSDGSRAAAARHDLNLVDGRLITVSGTIHPLGEPLFAPFSGTPCILCEYDLTSQKRLSAASDNENSGSDYAGFLMVPCVIRSAFGDVRMLGFPILENFSSSHATSYPDAARAREFLQSHEFEDRSGLKMVSVLSAFGDIWSDDDGLVQKNMRLGNVSMEELFPPSLDEDLLKIIRWQQEHPEDFIDSNDDDEDEDEDEDDEDDEGDSDYVAQGFTTKIPKLVEKRVEIGEQVCAIGIYNESMRGLLPPKGSSTPNRLLRGTPEQIETLSRTKVFQNTIGGLIGLLVIHGAIWGVTQIYRNSPDTIRAQQRRAEQALHKNDVDQLAALARRGLDVNFRDSNGRTLLTEAKEPEVSAWLIEHGADVNAIDNADEAALNHAARFGRTEIVRQLIAAKADLNPRSTTTNLTPLGEATLRGNDEVAELLRQAGATE